MGPRFVYRSITNNKQEDEGANDSAFRWIDANSSQGWEFVQILDLDGGNDPRLLFRKPV
jgi:hypothetical protein